MQLHEVKPGDSLWDRIARELPEDQMEQQLRAKLNEFEKEPNQHVWNALDSMLYKEEETSRWWKYAPLLLLFAIAAVAFVFISIQLYEGAARKTSNAKNQKEISPSTSPTKQTVVSTKELPTNSANINSSNAIQTTQATVAKPNTYNSDELGTENKRAVLPLSAKVSNTNTRTQTERANEVQNTSAQTKTPLLIPPTSATAHANDIPSQTSTLANESSTTKQAQPNALQNTDNDIKKPNEPIAGSDPQNNVNAILNTASDSLTQATALKDSSINNNIATQNEAAAKQVESNSDEDKPSRFSIGILAGANYSMMQLQSPQSNQYPLVENTQLRRSIERPQVDLAVQFLLKYHLNEQWAISSGVGRLLFRQTFFYNVTNPSIIKPEEALPNNAMYAKDSIIAGNNFQSEIRYSWTELPVSIHYQKQLTRKIQLHIQSGITYAVLANADVNMVNFDNIGVLQISNKNEFPGFRNSWFVHGGIGLLWRLNETVHLSAQPHMRVGMNNMVANKNWVEQRPMFVGFQLGIYKRL